MTTTTTCTVTLTVDVSEDDDFVSLRCTPHWNELREALGIEPDVIAKMDSASCVFRKES